MDIEKAISQKGQEQGRQGRQTDNPNAQLRDVEWRMIHGHKGADPLDRTFQDPRPTGQHMGRKLGWFRTAVAGSIALIAIAAGGANARADTVIERDPKTDTVRVYEEVKLVKEVTEGEGQKKQTFAVFKDTQGNELKFDPHRIRHISGHKADGKLPDFKPVGAKSIITAPSQGLLITSDKEWKSPLPPDSVIIPEGLAAGNSVDLLLPMKTNLTTSEKTKIKLPKGSEVHGGKGLVTTLLDEGEVQLDPGDYAVMGREATIKFTPELRALHPGQINMGPQGGMQVIPAGWIVEIQADKKVIAPAGTQMAPKPETKVVKTENMDFKGTWKVGDEGAVTIATQNEQGFITGTIPGNFQIEGRVEGDVLQFHWTDGGKLRWEGRISAKEDGVIQIKTRPANWTGDKWKHTGEARRP